jgi:hypothetical protein
MQSLAINAARQLPGFAVPSLSQDATKGAKSVIDFRRLSLWDAL